MENLRIKRINILALTAMLSELYDRGVDYVDIYGILEDGQDTLGMAFCKSYMNEEQAESFDDFGEVPLPSKVEVKLSKKDLNDLI